MKIKAEVMSELFSTSPISSGGSNILKNIKSNISQTDDIESSKEIILQSRNIYICE